MSIGRVHVSRRLVVSAAALVLGVAGALIAVGLTGGENALTLPTTGAYRPLTVQKPVVVNAQAGALIADPDSQIRQGQDLQINLQPLHGGHRYKLVVTNVSGIGAIDAFNWYPPNGVRIVDVLGSSAGSCVAHGTTGGGEAATPEIDCTGVGLKPPSCTCKGDGGRMTITFVTNENFGLPGAARVVAGDVHLKIIPSYVQTPDAPACKPGQTSSEAHPCTPA